MLNVKNTDKHPSFNTSYIEDGEEGRKEEEGVGEEYFFSLYSFEYMILFLG